jgi:hypothetical protein
VLAQIKVRLSDAKNAELSLDYPLARVFGSGNVPGVSEEAASGG